MHTQLQKKQNEEFCSLTANTVLYCMIFFTNSTHLTGLPKMLVIRNYYGVPSPAIGPVLRIQTGDVIELICADIHSPWWQVSALMFSVINPLVCYKYVYFYTVCVCDDVGAAFLFGIFGVLAKKTTTQLLKG